MTQATRTNSAGLLVFQAITSTSDIVEGWWDPGVGRIWVTLNEQLKETGDVEACVLIVYDDPGAATGLILPLVTKVKVRNGRGKHGLSWKRERVWLNCFIRCLVGKDDYGDARSLASVFQFAGRLEVQSGPKGLNCAIDNLLIASTQQPRSVRIAELNACPWGVRDGGGTPGLVARKLGLENDGGWELAQQQVRFALASDKSVEEQKSFRTPRIEQRVHRIGPDVELPQFHLKLKTGDWISLVQRSPLDWPPLNIEIRSLRRPEKWVAELSWSEPYRPPGTGGPWQDNKHVMEAWNRHAAEYHRRALSTERAGEAITLLPKFDEDAGDLAGYAPWIQVCRVTDADPDSPIVSPKSRISPPTLQPVRDIKVAGSFPGLRSLDGEMTRLSGSIRNSFLPRGAPHGLTTRADIGDCTSSPRTAMMESPEVDGKIIFSAILAPATADKLNVYRIGALDLTIGQVPPSLNNAPDSLNPFLSHIEATFADKTNELQFNTTIALPLHDITPGGQDNVPGGQSLPSGLTYLDSSDAVSEQRLSARFQREEALIVPFDVPSPSGAVARYVLQAMESAAKIYNRTLSLTINQIAASVLKEARRTENPNIAPSDDQTTRSLIILDRHPMLLAKIQFPPFKGVNLSGDANVLEVGEWRSDDVEGPHWNIRGAMGQFDLIMPPQTVGEAMRKMAPPSPDTGIATGARADFRFSPPAIFNLNSTPFQKRFAEAPWNLRRILGYPGQRAAGADVNTLRFEMLYGMTCTVTYRGLRLSEISARLGDVLASLPYLPPWAPNQTHHPLIGAYRKYRGYWANIYGRYLSRLSVLEAYSDAQVGLLLDRDVSYRLRPNADLRYPVDGAAPADTPAPHGPQGLAGGIGWGFESIGSYEQLWRNPLSVTGKLADPHFSALGGWGYQKAVFAEGNLIIHCHTAMGRVYYYSLERMGRIGVLWNTAKHVIVYERTVVPSDQFAIPLDVAAIPTQLVGRPVLRKVREYVEVMEPKRQYPESGAPAVTRGFIAGSDFKTRIMAVNGLRLRDLIDPNKTGSSSYVGYTIPLWDKLDAASKPTVYPRPQIILDCIGADGDQQRVNLELADPSQLVFYANTIDGAGSVPSLWPPVAEVDYLDLPYPASPPDLTALDPSAPEADLHDGAEIQPGYEQFTWSVLPPRRLINMVAERSAPSGGTSATMGAVLHNVTMMRAAKASVGVSKKLVTDITNAFKIPNAPDVDLVAITKAADAATNGLDRLRDAVKSGLQHSQLQKLVDSLIENDTNAVIKRTLSTIIPDWDAVKAQVRSNADKVVATINNDVKSLRNSALGSILASVNQAVKDALASYSAMEQSARDAATAAVRNAFDAATQAVSPICKALGSIRNLIGVPDAELDAIQKRIDSALDDLKAKCSVQPAPGQTLPIAQVLSFVDQTRQQIIGYLLNLERAFNRLRSTIPPFIAQTQGPEKALMELPSPVPALTNAVNGAFHQAIDAANGVAAAVSGAIDGCKTTCDTAVQNVKAILQPSRDLLNEIQQSCDDIDEKISTLGNELANTVSGIPDHDIATFTSKVNDAVNGKLDALDQKLGDIQTRFSAKIGHALEGVFSGLSDGAQAVSTTANKYILSLQKTCQNLIDQDPTTWVPALEQARHQVQDLGMRVQQGVDRIGRQVSGVAAGAKTVAGGIFQTGDSVLRTMRAFGDSPVVQTLDFNRKKVAYYLDEAKPFIETTPMAAFADRAKQELNGIAAEAKDALRGLRARVPTRQLLDRCVPDALKNFDLSSILPSFGGLELTKLFSGLKMPDLSDQNVKVTHGFDQAALRAWLHADVLVRFENDTTLFTFGPVMVRLKQANFEAHAATSAAASGATERSVMGAITGDWEINVGGFQVVTFRKTSLAFKDGSVKYNISPDRMDLNAVLHFVSDALALVGDPDSGFSVAVIPEGIDAILSLPLPDLVSGTTGISGLVLRAGFNLRILPDFSLGVSFGLARSDAPFNLSIFILGGSGFLEVGARYTPSSGKITAWASVNIYVSAMLELSLGPIKGLVYIGLGVTVDFHVESGGGPTSLALGAKLLIRGEVDCAGLISVCITLELILQYQTGSGQSRLFARGTLKISVKICWCFTFSFSTSIEYSFVTSGSSSSVSSRFPSPSPFAFALAGAVQAVGDPYDDAASNYIDMLE